MMHHLSIDIETYSSVPIAKAGLYKYAQSADFEILLFAYSLDGEPVQVVDFTEGKQIPREIWRHLYHADTIKHAFNAAFEWYCLERFFNRNPSGKPCVAWLHQWRDTMLHAMYCGYPASLDAAGKALGLPEDKRKLQAGKALIKIFCTPRTPTDRDPRIRIRPADEPEKWALFKEYNRQDVITEMEIERRLRDFPVPAGIQSQWEQDLTINSRGVALDMELVRGALDCSDRVTQKLTEEAVQISRLENPNSPAQITAWLKQRGIDTETLRKDDVTDLLESDQLDGDARRLLEIRQELSRTSTKKYNAMETAVGEDGRVRGTLQFYGANRTGRWCLTPDHEILTPYGWIRLDLWQGGEIACWSPQTEALSFQKSEVLCFDYEGTMYSLDTQRCAQISTPDHKMPVLQKNGAWGAAAVENAAKHRFTIPFTGRRLSGVTLEPDKLRVLIMTQADGHFVHEGDVRFHFKKQRKVERCKHLLRRCGIPFLLNSHSDKTMTISVKSRCLPLWLRQFKNKTFGWWLLDESPEIILDELSFWDGYRCGPNSVQYVTTNQQNAEVMQAVAELAGKSATLLIKKRDSKKWKDVYVLNIWLTPGKGTSIRIEQVKKISYAGKVYCASTPTGYFMVRRNGKVWITGNSGRLLQVQNLPRTYLHGAQLDQARQWAKERNTHAIDLLLGSVPDVLSQLIRTALVPSEGHVFIDADFSAIEARVIAWLAGEQWVLDVFGTHGKIYEACASQMFGVPIEKIVKGNPEYELRQKGKVATLALGYQGSTGALINMGALRMGIPEEDLPDIVSRWRSANKRIVDFWYAVEAAALDTVKTGRSNAVRSLVFALEGNQERCFMTITLPSSRKLYYAQPALALNRFGRQSLQYMGMNQTSRKWEPIETYGGKLVENIVQAAARDCLAISIARLETAGYPVVFHVHDEVVLDVQTENPDKALEDVCAIMGQPIDWAPGLPLKADGWFGAYYTKD